MEIDSEAWRQTVITGAQTLGVTVSVEQARRMGCHADELLRWNRTVNLTAIVDPLAVAVKHAVDSLAAVPWIAAGARVLDAGSGGGFPGIPLGIVRPDLSITLVDSVRKKVSFLRHVIRSLGMDRLQAIHGRLEDLGQTPAYGGQFDLVVCRAFSSLVAFSRLALPFLVSGGCLLAMKGPQEDPQEAGDHAGTDRAIILAGTAFAMRVQRYRLPFLDARRLLVQLTPVPAAAVPHGPTSA